MKFFEVLREFGVRTEVIGVDTQFPVEEFRGGEIVMWLQLIWALD